MNKKLIYSILGLIVALVIGGQIGSDYILSKKIDISQKDFNKIIDPNESTTRNIDKSNSLPAPDYGSLIKVSKVIDGDTIELENGERLRYIGIDTPESKDPRKPVQCFAEQASERNRKLVEGKLIKFYKDVNQRDKYNRLLGYVYLEDGTFINLELVKTGYAFSYPYTPDISKQEQFNESQSLAMSNKIGLWKDCIVNQTAQNRYQTNFK